MSFETVDRKLLSKDIENLSLAAIKRSYRALKRNTKSFRNQNVRDPLDHIDFEINLDKELTTLIETIENSRYHPKRPMIHYAPKSKGINRPTVSLSIEDMILYMFCIQQIDQEIVSSTRQKNIHGGVMASPLDIPSEDGFYEKWFKDWQEHNAAIVEALQKHPYVASTDISSYFENINIHVLEEILREIVKDKQNLLGLLFYFLESSKIRYGYKTKLSTGLLQDDIDCSRILAYLYLHPHDLRMISYGRDNDVEFFRFVDDMNITVSSKVEAKAVLKHLTTSLRELGLMASIEKTKILTSKQALKEIFYTENLKLSDLQTKIEQAIKDGKNLDDLTKELIAYYKKLKKSQRHKDLNWIKILRRFYTLGSYVQNDYLLDELTPHLIEYPSLVTEKKILKYILSNQASKKFNDAIERINDYLNSSENLYPQVETELVEILISFDDSLVSIATQVKLYLTARILLFGKKGSQPKAQSEFSRGIAVYMIYKYLDTSITEIVEYCLNKPIPSTFVKKCFAIVALTSENEDDREKLKRLLRSDTSSEMKRLLNLIDNMPHYKSYSKILKRYLSRNTYYIYFKNKKAWKQPAEVKVGYSQFRVVILEKLTQIHG